MSAKRSEFKANPVEEMREDELLACSFSGRAADAKNIQHEATKHFKNKEPSVIIILILPEKISQ